jgi:hypothetical protein
MERTARLLRFEEIFTPAARAKITRAVYRSGKWNGRRGQIPVRIRKAEPDLFNRDRLIVWRAEFGGLWINGDAGTVTEALEAIERKAAEEHMKRPDPKKLQRQCDEWNSVHPIGTTVAYHPVIGGEYHRIRTTRSGAVILGGHTAVVWLNGESGCVALEACAVVPPQ